VPTYGYARASTDGQTLDAQVAQLKAAGAEKVFREKASGARANRPELARLLRALSAGDVVLVTRLDRLARPTRDRLRQAGRLSFTTRHLGGYDDATWAAHANRARRLGRVRA
jgi:DNA invertase Pin-like site-specific DNA recombinase